MNIINKEELEFLIAIAVTKSELPVDKWVALTRRIANTLHRNIRRSDHDLVRHIYDLYYIAEAGYLNNTVHQIVLQVINEDTTRYKKHNSAYYDNPIAEINLALEALQKNSIWCEHWNRFTENMVLSSDKLSYNDAINSLVTNSEAILAYLSKIPITDFNCIFHHETSIDAEKSVREQPIISKEEKAPIR